MSKITNEGEWIIGYLEHQLSFENKLRPLYWENVRGWKEINKDAMERFKPEYYLRAIYYYGGKSKFLKIVSPTTEQVNESLVYLDTFELYPVLGKPRLVVELYRIDYAR